MRKRWQLGAGALLAGISLSLPAQNTLPDAPQAKPIVYQPGGEVVGPKLVYMVAPELPKDAVKNRVKGVATVSVVVDAEGEPQDVKLFRSATETVNQKYRYVGYEMDDEALKVVRQYRFKPGTLKGKPVNVAIHVDVNFQLF